MWDGGLFLRRCMDFNIWGFRAFSDRIMDGLVGQTTLRMKIVVIVLLVVREYKDFLLLVYS